MYAIPTQVRVKVHHVVLEAWLLVFKCNKNLKTF